MRRFGVLVLAVLSAGASSAAQSQDTASVQTVSGVFRGTCVARSSPHEGDYRYTLGDRRLPSLEGECSPGNSASNVNIGQVWRSPRSTTVLMTEGISAVAQSVRLIHFALGQEPLMIELYGHDVPSSQRDTEAVFRLRHHVVNMAGQQWDCDYEIDFAARSVSGSLASSSSREISAEQCEAEVVEVSVGQAANR